ncbi:MAG TPA: NHL repeat-containing protein, partial [Isosphaeraceae bacterium]
LDAPWGLDHDADGNLYVVDANKNRIIPYNPALAPQPALGGPVPTPASVPVPADQLKGPRGLAVVRRAEPLLYIADEGNNRVTILKRDGTPAATPPITTDGTTALKRPEDVATDADGNVYIADTGNARILKFGANDSFLRAITIHTAGQSFAQPSGVAVADDGTLLVTDRLNEKVYRVNSDGALLAFWDLDNLLRKSVKSNSNYDVELARLLVFKRPNRAAIDPRGLLAVADADQDRIRLVRTRTEIDVNLFDLGEDLPDISFRVRAEADLKTELALKVEVADRGIVFDDTNEFETDAEDDFTRDHYEQSRILGPAGNLGAAANAMKVVRTLQRWLKHLTRQDDPAHRWAADPSKAKTFVVDITKESESNRPWGKAVINLRRDTDGRGPDAWDDSVVAHEMAHWVFEASVHPEPPFMRIGGDHALDQVIRQNTAITEGFADYVALFWGDKSGSTDRVRGFRMATRDPLANVDLEPDSKKTARTEYLVGGPTSAPPTFNAPGRGLFNEGYFAHALWQIHHAVAEPGILFADAPSFWYPHNTFLTDAQSGRFARILRQALRSFPEHPTAAEWVQGSRVYLRQVLAQAHAEGAAWAALVQAICELNNQLMPTIAVTEGTSDTSPGAAVPTPVELHP